MTNEDLTSLIQEGMVEYLGRYLGVPYLWGGDSPLGFDCSGLVLEGLKSHGVVAHKIDLSAQGIYDLLSPNHLTNGSCRAGLVFFGQDLKQISHVGLALNELVMIEAGGGGSWATDPKLALQKGAFVKTRPIRYRKDFLTIIKPDYGTIVASRGLLGT